MITATEGVGPTSHVHTLGPLPRRNLSMLTDRVFPALRRLIELGYFSLEVEGAQHVPRSGPMIYVGNHAGWFTLDTLMGALAVTDHVGTHRLPWGAVQDQALKAPRIGPFFEAMGGFPASWLRTPEAMPAAMEVFSIYPEGADGSCKSFVHAYQMRAWRTGFLRMALARNAVIAPLAIIGGEECLPTAFPLNAAKALLGTTLPVPLSLLPLPTRWRLIFLPPVRLSDAGLDARNPDTEPQRQRLRELSDHIRMRVQSTLDAHTSHRRLVRFSGLLKRVLS